MTNKQELAAFDSTQVGTTASVIVDKFSRLIHGIALQSVHTTAATVRTFSDDVEYVIVKFGSDQEILINPVEQRKLDNVLNGTSDTIPADYLFIPFTRLGIPWSPLGTSNIPQIQIQVKIKAGITNFARIRGFLVYKPLNSPVPAGDRFVQTVIPVTNVVAGRNVINDLPYQDIVAVTHLLLNADPITSVKVKIGDEEVYNLTKRDMAFALAMNPLYKLPGTLDFFTVIFDDLGEPGDYMPLIRGGVRRNLSIEFNWDTGVAAVAPFNILAVGVKRGALAPVATAAA